MRWHLLKTFDKIYIIDLHGNSKKKEVSPDGSKDENVFDIMQGVSINIFVKTGKKKANELGRVFHYDLYGRRKEKYKFLLNSDINSVPYVELPNQESSYFFVQKDFKKKKSYDKGFSVKELFPLNSVGIVTGKDSFYIDYYKKNLISKIEEHYGRIDKSLIRNINYRPFDIRYLYNNIKLIERNRFKVMQHFLKGENVGLITIRRSRSNKNWKEIFVTNKIISGATSISALDINYVFPLYLYPDKNNKELPMEGREVKRKPNLEIKIVEKIAEDLGLEFENEKSGEKGKFAPLDILDYIYGVLHSPTYRGKYQAFLKIDFPRVPYPKGKKAFWDVAKLGGELREIHLLTSPVLEKYITKYPVDGSNRVENIFYNKKGQVFVNEKQYFDQVPEVAWHFYIGGYQPAQKWLKDRKGRRLSVDEIMHYQKIIVALMETDRIMGVIDGIDVV